LSIHTSTEGAENRNNFEVPVPTAKEVEAGEVFQGEYKKKFKVIRP
jgi:hypothetical protein